MRIPFTLSVSAFILATIVLVQPALADEFQLTIHSAVAVSGSNWNNDNYEGWYVSGYSTEGTVELFAGGTIPGFSFSICPGCQIIGAYSAVSVAGTPEESTATLGIGSGMFGPPRPDMDNPISIAPTFAPATVVGLTQWDMGVPTIQFDGNQVVVDPYDVLLFTFATAGINNPGNNWWGFIGGTATATVDYTLQIDGEYEPAANTPEPSSFVLLGTAVLGSLYQITRRKKTT